MLINAARKKKDQKKQNYFVARPAGFEPAISGVTGRRLNPSTMDAGQGLDSNQGYTEGLQPIYMPRSVS